MTTQRKRSTRENRSTDDRARRVHAFLFYVRKTDHCWFWRGATNKTGYGISSLRGGSQLAHRMAWQLFRGPIPPGLDLRHGCDNRRCVNPNHLTPGTHLQNMRDAVERKRFPPRGGEANPRAKLTREIVAVIRADRASTNVELAKVYGVSDNAISWARSGKTWKEARP